MAAQESANGVSDDDDELMPSDMPSDVHGKFRAAATPRTFAVYLLLRGRRPTSDVPTDDLPWVWCSKGSPIHAKQGDPGY